MKTELTRYDEIKVNDLIFTNGQDNHMFRKLKFNEVEKVLTVENYLSKSGLNIYRIVFESKNVSYGINDRVLEKVVE